MDLEAGEEVISAVERIPDRELEDIFRPYAEAREATLSRKGWTDSSRVRAEDLLEGLVERKHRLREEFEGFYEEMRALRAATGAAGLG